MPLGRSRYTTREAWLGLWAPLGLCVLMMWRVRAWTVDDAYISYRYARNFARGEGLVYNVGEHVEGYTNFLWTLILGLGMRLGVGPNLCAKALGAGACAATVFVVYRLSLKLRPQGSAPVAATWLFATSVVATGYAVWGLETPLFTLAIAGGTLLFLEERERPGDFPWSGLAFAVAGLTRPEAPLFVGILMASLGRQAFARQNMLRLACFAAPVLGHVAWRYGYYGSLVPNTLHAKTGGNAEQLRAGLVYLRDYAMHAGLLVLIGLWGLARAIQERNRDLSILVVMIGAFACYLVAIGGDWMPLFRFVAPIEPFAFVIVGLSIRDVWDRGDRTVRLALAAFLVLGMGQRLLHLHRAQKEVLEFHEPYWRETWASVGRFLADQPPGTIGIADIGVVGWITDYPVLDTLGLVDPVISRLSGGYTDKTGDGYLERVFEVRPRYWVYPPTEGDCTTPFFAAHRRVTEDPRFANYELIGEPGGAFGPICVSARPE